LKKFKKVFSTILKVGVSVLLLYLVFRKVPFAEVWELIKKSNLFFLFLALFAFIISQILSSQRLLFYFFAHHFQLKSVHNFKLYLVGMFYNFFIPGGIGGDAYKVYLLNKRFGWNIKKLSSAVLCDRFSGLLAIVLLLEVLSITIFDGFWKLLILPAIIVTIVAARFIFAKIFPTYKSIYFKTILLSLAVQTMQLVCIYFILRSFSTVQEVWIYWSVFLMSSVLSIISFSGIGVREWLFMQASHFFNFNTGVSVSTAMIFSFLTALVSLFGIAFELKGLKLEEECSTGV